MLRNPAVLLRAHADYMHMSNLLTSLLAEYGQGAQIKRVR